MGVMAFEVCRRARDARWIVRLNNSVYGAYLDHNPNPEGYAKELARTAGEIAEYTRSMLIKYYGSLVHTIWGTDVMRPCLVDNVPPPPPR